MPGRVGELAGEPPPPRPRRPWRGARVRPGGREEAAAGADLRNGTTTASGCGRHGPVARPTTVAGPAVANSWSADKGTMAGSPTRTIRWHGSPS